jgi:hypothetical protein
MDAVKGKEVLSNMAVSVMEPLPGETQEELALREELTRKEIAALTDGMTPEDIVSAIINASLFIQLEQEAAWMNCLKNN